MSSKDFSFSYNIKTKSGKMKISDKYINIFAKKKIPSGCSSGGLGYGINLLWEDKK